MKSLIKIIILSITILSFTNDIYAHPSLTDHINNDPTIAWERDGSQDGTSAHNHRSNRDFGGINNNGEPYSVFHCWDNRTDRLDLTTNFDEGHCFIDGYSHRVRYRFIGIWPSAAKTAMRAAFDAYEDVVSDRTDLDLTATFREVSANSAAEIDLFWENQSGLSGGGYYDFTQEIHMDSSMNWFFGISPTGIANNQWHFFSVALHEVGHAIAFNHQLDSDLMDPSVGEPMNTPGFRHFTNLDADTIEGVRDVYSQPKNIHFTYFNQKINGYLPGTKGIFGPGATIYNLSTPAETAERFCQDYGLFASISYLSDIRGSAYSYINGQNGQGNWSVTGNSGVTMLDEIKCFDTANVIVSQSYSNPTVNGYRVGRIYPASLEERKENAKQFCINKGHEAGYISYSLNYPTGTTYSYWTGSSWGISGSSSVELFSSVTCANIN